MTFSNDNTLKKNIFNLKRQLLLLLPKKILILRLLNRRYKNVEMKLSNSLEKMNFLRFL